MVRQHINNGQQNRPGGRSILDYSLIVTFTLVGLLLILVLDAYEYVSVPGASHARDKIAALTGDGAVTSDELEDVLKRIEQAKADLEAKRLEVEEIVKKTEVEIHDREKEKQKQAEEVVKKTEVEISDKEKQPDKEVVKETQVEATIVEETPEEKAAEEKKEEDVIEAVIEKELGIDQFCGDCQFGGMKFTCDTRVSWMVKTYGITEDAAKMSALQFCHKRRLRGS